MSSITFEGVYFQAYPDDHPPAHVHGFYGDVEVIVELLAADVQLSKRRRNVRPPDAKVSDVAHVLDVAADHVHSLWRLWEEMHAS